MQMTPFGARSGRIPAVFCLAAVLALPACRKNNAPETLPPRAQVIKDVPRIPNATLLDTAGTPEAERWTHVVASPFDSTRHFFRDTLPKLGWTIGSETENRERETLDLYAQKGDQNVWIQLRGQLWEFGIRRTLYTVIAAQGGVRDSTAPVRPPPMPAHPR